MISEGLRQEATDYEASVRRTSYNEGYEAAKAEYEAKVAEARAEYEDKLEKLSATHLNAMTQLEDEYKSYIEGLKSAEEANKKALAELEEEYKTTVENLKTEYEAKVEAARKEGYDEGVKSAMAEVPEEEEPVIKDVYSTETAKANLLAAKGDNALVFGIMDTLGNVYLNGDDWKAAGSPAVLGIAYTDGKMFLCMHIKKIASAPFGGNGVNFKGVYTTKVQWRNAANKVTPAFDDYSGVSNTEGIINGCDDSIAAKCRAVVFGNGRNGYMPACGELRIFCKYFKWVDGLLKSVGGDILKTVYAAQFFFSSTCRDATTVWDVRYYQAGDAQPAYRAKTAKLPTRVFVEL